MMLKTAQANNKQEKGQSLVEFAVSLVLILIILGAAVDLGRLFFYYISLRDAAQEGALYGSAYPCEYNDMIQRSADLLSGDAKITVRVSNTSGSSYKEFDSTMSYDDESNSVFTTQWQTLVKNTSTTKIQVKVEDDDFMLSMPLVGGRSIKLGATADATILRHTCE